jgi:hypothetical protein
MNLRERGGQYLAMQGRNGRRNDRAQLFGADAYGRPRNTYGNSGHPASSVHQEHANNMLEKQNDEVIDSLFETARNIKNYSQTINRQAKEQNEMLSAMGIQMDKTQGLLGRTLGKMENMMKNGGSKHMCYMICFFVFMIWMLYFFAFSKKNDVVLINDESLTPIPSP